MFDYRLYCLKSDGAIASADWIEARSDDEAIVLARAKKLAFRCELWLRDRQIATIPAHHETATTETS